MNRRLTENLKNENGNYILPFFWQHGEAQNILEEEIDAIKNSGINEFCVESRIYEKFCEEPWWCDFGFILEQAEKRQMRVWLLDDIRFPTGFANGAIRDKYPELRKWHIRESHVDVAGPMDDASLIVDKWLEPLNEESILGCVACQRSGEAEDLTGKSINLSSNISDGILEWNIPAGIWRVFYFIKTRKAPPAYKHYIDMLNPHSVNILLEAVYEPHYSHFSKYFGNTFAGFFSDEPCLGNETGTYNSKLGKPDLLLPWRDDFPELFSEVIASDIFTLLPGLWFNIGPQTSNIRVAYMNLVTKLYGKCFSQKLGDWCRGHGVEYIGHIVEDMNCHTSTGTSVGHFFRGLSGQDMSGIDVVLHQIVPGHSDISHASPAWGTIGAADPEFFHYSLAKLASSDAHIDSRKKGRALCEIFGAYGWAEGLPMMKWLTDHMLVRGINHFVPHAFSPKYPDMDCPPHFYARGNNPQFLQFRQLMEYTNRICHLFNGGRHISTAAILYHAEAEWSGGKFMLSQKPAKQLADNQIDYDIISSDYLSLARVINGKMQLNDELYSCLIVPFSEILPYDTIKTLGRLASEGLKVFYIDAAPLNTAENKPTDDISGLDKIECVPLNGLVNIINEYNICDIMPDRKCPLLRFYHYQQAETHFYMFFNEDIHNNADVSVNIGQSGPCYFYNAFENRLEKAEYHNGVLKLCLSTYESKIAVFGEINGFDIHSLPAKTVPLKLDLSYKIELKRNAAEEYSVFKSASPLFNITTRHDGVADFSGFIRYTATFSLNDTSYNYLDLGQVYETAKIYLNGTYIGSRICPPYLYEIRDLLKHGENTIEVLVVNNLAHAERDPLSCFLAVPPSGLLGPVVLC